MKFQPFHIVDKSPWPLIGSIAAFTFITGILDLIHFNNINIIFISILIITATIIQWWRDICREASFQGNHTLNVLINIKWGIALFIISEIFFFLSFFWAFFHRRLSPNIEIGSQWPPTAIYPFNPFRIPLLNTTILLSSGISITWSHHRILINNYLEAKNSLILTITLGILFTFLQEWEYLEASFRISDSIFGSIFFISTGFHGLHVIIGSTFLIISLLRLTRRHYSNKHHFGFEAAAWYWHFVDVVWLFLYTFVYWWTF